MSNLGMMIKQKRKDAGLSQKKLGLECGISDSEIMKIERGERKTPSWENLCKIAGALHFHPIEILLAAGYISEADVLHWSPFKNVDKLDNADMEIVQAFIDFLGTRKK